MKEQDLLNAFYEDIHAKRYREGSVAKTLYTHLTPEEFDKAMANIVKKHGDGYAEKTDSKGIIFDMMSAEQTFWWTGSKEGDQYWKNIYDRLYDDE
jgi:hypothetical protein